jgi:hypothetical protein
VFALLDRELLMPDDERRPGYDLRIAVASPKMARKD